MDGMITLKDVCKTYCIGGDTVHALDHANMVIREGEFVSIIGPSGSGKSTFYCPLTAKIHDDEYYRLSGYRR